MTVTKNAWTNVCGLCEHTHISHTSDTGNSLMRVPRRRQGGLSWIAQCPHWAATWGFLKTPLLCSRTLRALPQTISSEASYNLPGAQWRTVAENKGPRREQYRGQENSRHGLWMCFSHQMLRWPVLLPASFLAFETMWVHAYFGFCIWKPVPQVRW